MKKKGLSPKQRRFVAEYLKDQNASQASIRAGYSKKNPNVVGPRLLANVGIRAAIDAAIGKIEEKALVDAAYVLTGLKRVHERCLKPEPIMEFDHEEKTMVQAVDEDGNFVYQFDSAGANRSLELLGKHLKLFTEKSEVSGKDGEPLTINIVVYGKPNDPA